MRIFTSLRILIIIALVLFIVFTLDFLSLKKLIYKHYSEKVREFSIAKVNTLIVESDAYVNIIDSNEDKIMFIAEYEDNMDYSLIFNVEGNTLKINSKKINIDNFRVNIYIKNLETLKVVSSSFVDWKMRTFKRNLNLELDSKPFLNIRDGRVENLKIKSSPSSSALVELSNLKITNVHLELDSSNDIINFKRAKINNGAISKEDGKLDFTLTGHLLETEIDSI